jgi:transposase InsO family protein
MREDNLLCVRKRKFVVTTDSNHGLKVYPNLASKMELSGINQLWVADITYIRLEAEFVYLAVVIDSFSRRVVGWALGRTLQDDLPLEALRIAFERRQPASGLVHHSDRGSQYASYDYTDLLKVHGCRISMSHKASPWENGGCESWVKTLKYEGCSGRSTAICGRLAPAWNASLTKSTMSSGCIPRSAIVHRRSSSKPCWRRSTQERPNATIRYSCLSAAWQFSAEAKAPFTGKPCKRPDSTWAGL